MKTFSYLVLVASVALTLACSGSHAGDYLHNQTVYDNIVGNPVYVEETSWLGEKTIRLSYDNKNRCAGWKKTGGCYDNVERIIEYDGENISKITNRFLFPEEELLSTQVVIVDSPDSTVLYSPEDTTTVRIIGGRLTTFDNQGKIIIESQLDEKGRELSYKSEYLDRTISYTRNGDVSLLKATSPKSGDVYTSKYEYLCFDKKGNWTEAVEISNDRTDTVRRIICYNSKEVEKLFAEKKNKNKLAAKEYLDLKFSESAPWTINDVWLTDSLATPFSDLMSLKIQYSQLSLDMVRANTLRKVNDISEQETRLYEGLLRAARMYDNPEGPDKDRLGFKAEARRAYSNTDEPIYFFFNADKSIGHCSLELKQFITEVEESRNTFMRYKRETLSYLR